MGTTELKDSYFEALELRTQVQRKVIELKVKVEALNKRTTDLDKGDFTAELGAVAVDLYRAYRQLGIEEQNLVNADKEVARAYSAYLESGGGPIA